jgi:hypothetical protein
LSVLIAGLGTTRQAHLERSGSDHQLCKVHELDMSHSSCNLDLD